MFLCLKCSQRIIAYTLAGSSLKIQTEKSVFLSEKQIGNYAVSIIDIVVIKIAVVVDVPRIVVIVIVRRPQPPIARRFIR